MEVEQPLLTAAVLTQAASVLARKQWVHGEGGWGL